eukprot:jgi/Mesvir1/13079/Mv06064-RA.2
MQLVSSFLQSYQLSTEEVHALRDSAMDASFFRALHRVQEIHSNCKVLLRTHHQRAGLELMDAMASYQEAAYERLCRWVQTEAKALGNSDTPEVSPLLRMASHTLRERPVLYKYSAEEVANTRHNALFRRFIAALTRGGPGGMPRPIEMHAHDPRRYVGDMLGWLHQALASERELAVALFGNDDAWSSDDPLALAGKGRDAASRGAANGGKRQGGGKGGGDGGLANGGGDKGDNGAAHHHTSSGEDLVSVESVLDRVMEGVSRPFKVRVEQVLSSSPGLIVLYRLSNLLEFYLHTINPLLGRGATLCATLADCQLSARRAFESQLRSWGDKMVRYPPAVPADLSPPPALAEGVIKMVEILDVHASAMHAPATGDDDDNGDDGANNDPDYANVNNNDADPNDPYGLGEGSSSNGAHFGDGSVTGGSSNRGDVTGPISRKSATSSSSRAGGSSSSSSAAGFAPVLSAVVDPLVQMCEKSAESLLARAAGSGGGNLGPGGGARGAMPPSSSTGKLPSAASTPITASVLGVVAGIAAAGTLPAVSGGSNSEDSSGGGGSTGGPPAGAAGGGLHRSVSMGGVASKGVAELISGGGASASIARSSHHIYLINCLSALTVPLLAYPVASRHVAVLGRRLEAILQELVEDEVALVLIQCGLKDKVDAIAALAADELSAAAGTSPAPSLPSPAEGAGATEHSGKEVMAPPHKAADYPVLSQVDMAEALRKFYARIAGPAPLPEFERVQPARVRTEAANRVATGVVAAYDAVYQFVADPRNGYAEGGVGLRHSTEQIKTILGV